MRLFGWWHERRRLRCYMIDRGLFPKFWERNTTRYKRLRDALETPRSTRSDMFRAIADVTGIPQTKIGYMQTSNKVTVILPARTSMWKLRAAQASIEQWAPAHVVVDVVVAKFGKSAWSW